MTYGLIQQGQTVKSQALGGLQKSAQLEDNRNLTNKQFEEQHKSTKVSGATAGAMTGAMYGMSKGAVVGGPAGAAIGLVAGYLLPELL